MSSVVKSCGDFCQRCVTAPESPRRRELSHTETLLLDTQDGFLKKIEQLVLRILLFPQYISLVREDKQFRAHFEAFQENWLTPSNLIRWTWKVGLIAGSLYLLFSGREYLFPATLFTRSVGYLKTVSFVQNFFKNHIYLKNCAKILSMRMVTPLISFPSVISFFRGAKRVPVENQRERWVSLKKWFGWQAIHVIHLAIIHQQRSLSVLWWSYMALFSTPTEWIAMKMQQVALRTLSSLTEEMQIYLG